MVAGPRRRLRRGPASRVGGKLAIASSAQPRRENRAAEFSSVRVGPPFPDIQILGFCGGGQKEEIGGQEEVVNFGGGCDKRFFF